MAAKVIGIVAALALVALLAAPWYSANLIGPGGPVGEPGKASGWTVLSTTDALLFACAAIAASGLCIGGRKAAAIASVAASAAVGFGDPSGARRARRWIDRAGCHA